MIRAFLLAVALAALSLWLHPAGAQVVTGLPPAATPSLPGLGINEQLAYVTNNWYTAATYNTAAGTPVTPGANKIVCGYGVFANPITISAIGANVTTNDAGLHFQFGIYTAGSWGRPSTLVINTASITLAGTGSINGATAASLPAGGYWLCENTDSAVAILSSQASSAGNANFSTAAFGSATQSQAISAGAEISGISVASTFNTWPASFLSNQAWVEVTTASVPILVVKVASSP